LSILSFPTLNIHLIIADIQTTAKSTNSQHDFANPPDHNYHIRATIWRVHDCRLRRRLVD
jgi:hypothetical protein